MARVIFVFVFSQLTVFHKHNHFSNFCYFSYMRNLSWINKISRTFYYVNYFIFILAVGNDNQRRRMILPGWLGIVGLVPVRDKRKKNS